MSDLLNAQDLVKKYGRDENTAPAVNHISMNFDENEVVSIVGQSGSGKSTLLHMLSGIDRPTSGRVLLDGKDIFEMSSREKTKLRLNNIGFVFQFFNLIPNLTAYDNAILPAVLNKNSAKKKQYAMELLEEAGLKDKLHSLPSQMSGGEQQRVAIVRAMINSPKIIFADEPTGNLDTENGQRVFDMLMKYTRENKQTLIFVTHDRRLANMADRTVEIADGEVLNEH